MKSSRVKPKQAFAIDSSAPPAFWRALLAVEWCRSDPAGEVIAPTRQGDWGTGSAVLYGHPRPRVSTHSHGCTERANPSQYSEAPSHPSLQNRESWSAGWHLAVITERASACPSFRTLHARGSCGRYAGGWPTIRFDGLEAEEISRRTPRPAPRCRLRPRCGGNILTIPEAFSWLSA